ncbi:MAG: c-type cytochrome [Rhodanobacter sp.]
MRRDLKRMTTALAAVFLVMGAARASASTTIGSETAQNAAIRAAQAWAFPMEQTPDPSVPKPLHAPKPDPHKIVHVPGSVRTYTLGYIDTLFNATDWFPQDHPAPPRIVLHGRKPAWACGSCHFPNGAGDTTSPALAGLPKAYILQQIAAFRDGERGMGQSLSATMMTQEARNLGDADLQQAADYFSRLKLHLATRVVETSSVPRTHWVGFVLAPNRNGAHEPIGERIIEVSNDQALNDLGDERTGFVAYVPLGSIARGAVIAAHGVGSAPACESCHGAALEGVGNIPPLAGQSPTYIVRELILFQIGKRTNPESAPMQMVASQFSVRDMIAVAAYAASRKP